MTVEIAIAAAGLFVALVGLALTVWRNTTTVARWTGAVTERLAAQGARLDSHSDRIEALRETVSDHGNELAALTARAGLLERRDR